MPQSTSRWISRKVDELRNAPQLPFHDLLDPDTVVRVVDANHVGFRDRIFSPLVTLWTFLSQVLSPDHSCREAVARLIAFRVARGEKPCGPETGSYCKARQRLPLKVVTDLARGTAQSVDEKAKDSLTWKGRSVHLVDGSTVSMPDTPANQEVFPQPESQKPGLGFPLARLVAVISLATGVVRELALGRYQGKETGETALFRSLWDRFRAGDIIVGDRYFASFFGIAPLLAARRRWGVPDASAAEVRLPAGMSVGGGGPCGELDQAVETGVDGSSPIRPTARGTEDPRVAGESSIAQASGWRNWCW